MLKTQYTEATNNTKVTNTPIEGENRETKHLISGHGGSTAQLHTGYAGDTKNGKEFVDDLQKRLIKNSEDETVSLYILNREGEIPGPKKGGGSTALLHQRNAGFEQESLEDMQSRLRNNTHNQHLNVLVVKSESDPEEDDIPSSPKKNGKII